MTGTEPRPWGIAAVLLAALVVVTAGIATFGAAAGAGSALPITEGFDADSPSNWDFYGTDDDGGESHVAAPGVQVGPGDEPSLLLTQNDGNQAGTALYTPSFSSDNGITAEFRYYSAEGTGADGFTFFLLDESDLSGGFSESDIGDSGGALGYGDTGSGGIKGGFIGVGFDEWGNFDEATYGESSGGDQEITIRGSTDTTRAPVVATSDLSSNTVDGGWRRARITVDPTAGSSSEVEISVYVDFTEDGSYTEVFAPTLYDLGTDIDEESGRMPSDFRLGFSGSTGGSTNVHAIDDLSVRKPADLTTTVTAAPSNGPYEAGDTVEYTVDVSNNGPNADSSVTVSPSVSVGASGLESLQWDTDGGSFDADDTGSSTTISLASGETKTVTLRATVGDSATGNLDHTVSASTSGDFNDPSPGDAEASVSVGLNDAPSFASDESLSNIDEDVDPASNGGAQTDSNELFGDEFSDADGDSLAGIVVTDDAATDSEGTWQYSTDDGSTWYAVDDGSLSASNGLALPATADLRFDPATDYNGDPGDLTVFAVDDGSSTTVTSGATRETFDTTADGAASQVASTSNTVSITVDPVDDPPTLTTSGGDASYTTESGAVVVDSGLTVSDPDGGTVDGAKVTIGEGFDSSEDSLGWDSSVASDNGLSGSYDSSAGVLTFTGTATPAEVQSVLRTVTYDNAATDPAMADRAITFTLGSGSLYNPDTGHYYEFVSDSGIDWDTAKTAAAGKTHYGLQGYLVTVTSGAENDFVASKLSGEGWMGATDRASEGTWRWVTGPEGTEESGAGRHFFTQTASQLGTEYGGSTGGGGDAVDGEYNNWNSGEPNNYNGQEDRAHFFADGGWNDYANGNDAIAGYVVEYGGSAGDPSIQLSDDRTVTVSDATAPAVSAFSVSNPSGQDVKISFDADEQLSTISVSITGAESATLTTSDFTETDNGDGTYTYEATYAGSSEGDYTATLDTASDAAGNDGSSGESASVTVDTTAPSVSAFAASNPSGQDVKISFDADEQLSTLSVSITGAESATLSAADFTETDDGDGTYTYEATYAGGSEGTYTATLDTAADAADNDGSSGESASATVDTITPSVSAFAVTNPSGQDVKITFDSDEQLSTVSVSISDAESATLTASDFAETDNGDGTYSYAATYAGGSEGTYTATLDTAVDAAGNDGASGESASASIDTTVDTVDAGPDQTVASGETATLDATGSSDASGIATYEWDYGNDGTVDARGATVDHEFFAPGEHTVGLTVVDGNGNSATDTLTVTVGSVDNWPTFHGDRANVGHDPDATGPTAPVEEAWRVALDSYVVMNPALVDGTLYAGEYRGNLYAFDAATGTEQWSFDPTNGKRNDGYGWASPTVADGTVYVGNRNGHVYAVDAATGTKQWAFDTGAYDIHSTPVVDDGTVYVGDSSGTLHALDASTGSQQWTFETASNARYHSNDIESNLAVVDDRAYFAVDDGEVFAVDTASGSGVWSHDLGNYTQSDPTVVDNTLFIGDSAGNVYALDASDGSERWQHEFARKNRGYYHSVTAGQAYADGTLYVTDESGNVTALSATDGSQVWQAETGSANGRYGDAIYSAPVVVNGTVYVTQTSEGVVYAFDAADGSEQWAYDSELPSLYSTPTVADGTLYYGGYRGLAALGEGDQPPTADAGSSITTPEDAEITFDASASTDDAGIGSYAWTFGDGDSASGQTPTHTYGDSGEYTATLTVTDTAGQTDTDSVAVTVTENSVLVGDAGGNVTADEDTPVSFDASGSKSNEGGLSYEWDFDGDGTADATGAAPSYTFADPGTYEVTLTLTDAEGNEATDTVVATVRDTTAPTADAGADRAVDEDTTLSFDGTASMDNGEVASYRWSFDGTVVTGARATHAFDAPGTYNVTLSVADESGNTATDFVNVTVRDTTAPQADAGSNVTAPENGEIDFDGTNSTDNDAIDSYAWDFDGDGTTGATGATPSHTYSTEGTYTLALEVTDPAGNTATDAVQVTVTDTSVLVVDAGGNLTTGSGVATDFDASDTESNEGGLTYSWDFDGDDSEDATGVVPTYTFTTVGTQEVSVTVTDAEGNEATDSLWVTVTDTTPPTADAGSAVTGAQGAPVIFDGTNSTDDGTVASHQWDFDGDGAIDATGATPSYTYDAAGSYTAELVVTDAAGNVATDTVSVTVTDTEAPTADAGSDLRVRPGGTLRLAGERSTDNVGIAAYRWDINDDGAVDARGETVRWEFFAPGEHTVALTVVDAAGNSATDRITVTVGNKSDWPTHQGDPARIGYDRNATNPPTPVEEVWRLDSDSYVVMNPALVDGTLYAGEHYGDLFAVDASTGAREWTFSPSDEEYGSGFTWSSPAVVDGTVYIGANDGVVYAVDAATGTKQWSFDTGSYQVESSPAVVDGTVYVGDGEDTLWALDAASGAQQWRYETDDGEYYGYGFDASPAVVDGTVYVADYSGTVHAVDAATGDAVWTHDIGNYTQSDPTVTGNTVYLGDGAGYVHALNASDGTERWRVDLPGVYGGVSSSLAFAEGTLYAVDESGNVTALSATDGSQIWRVETGDGDRYYREAIYSAPLVANGTLYVAATEGGVVYALDPATGAEQWTYDAPIAYLYATPVVGDGLLYYGGYGGLAALGDADGRRGVLDHDARGRRNRVRRERLVGRRRDQLLRVGLR